MIFSTITQNELTLSVDSYNLPTQNSNNIQLKFVQDTENFSGYTPTVAMALLDSALVSCADVLNEGGFVPIQSDGTFLVQDNILSQDGFLAVAINLTQTTGSTTENVMLGPVVYKIKANISALSPLPPDDNLWQSVVTAFLQSVYDNDYKPQFDQIQQDLENLVTEAQQQQQTAEQQQTQIDNAISVMGEYQIVSNDPVQIQFKQGDGTYGPTVDLGDGLASKSMVNAGYYQSIGSQYSGAASDYGIEVEEIVGAYVKDGTPTPDAPIEPQFVQIENFNTNGGNLFDASKLPTKSQGGATVTNNGDGSLTVSGNGTLTESFTINYVYSAEDALALLKVGKCKLNLNGSNSVNPDFTYGLYTSNGIAVPGKYLTKNLNSIDITEEDIDKISSGEYRLNLYMYGGVNTTITQVTIKPMVYQDGDGTWYPFNASNTPVSLELMALPNGVADTWENGTLTHNVASVTFDGSEAWAMSGINYGDYVAFYMNGYIAKSLVICNKFPYYNFENNQADKEAIYVFGDGSLRILILKSRLSEISANGFKQWLSQNPITVWYQLATPTTEQLAIPTLTSFYPFTNAWCDSVVQPQITWNVLTGKSSILDGNGNLIQQGYMTPQDNLLTNSDFKSGIINQKVQTSYVVDTSNYQYTIDMWRTKGMTVTVNANSVTIKNSSGSSQVFQQIFTKPSDDYMAVVNVLSVTGNTYIDINNVKSSKLIQGLNNFEYTGEIGFFSIRVDNGATIQIEFMKLEKGSYFTGMPAWNASSELQKCLYYYEIKSIVGLAIGGTFQQFLQSTQANYYFPMQGFVTKNKTPTITVLSISSNEGPVSNLTATAQGITNNSLSALVTNNQCDRPYLIFELAIDANDY